VLAYIRRQLGSGRFGVTLALVMVGFILMMMALKETCFISRSVHIFKRIGERIMDIEKAQKVIDQIKSLESPRWASSKLWVTVGLIGGLIWLFNTTLHLVLWPVTILAGVWLACRTVESVFEGLNKRKIKEALIKEAAKDGLTAEEITVINK
jgi:hypothetical protein